MVGINLLCGLSARWASGERPDAWITTRTRIALLTADGAGRTAVKVDTEQGGVRSVRNLVAVVPAASKIETGDQ